MIISIGEIVELNKQLEKKGALSVHLCDSCGGQVLRLEGAEENSPEFLAGMREVTAFFAAKRGEVVSKGGIYFSVD